MEFINAWKGYKNKELPISPKKLYKYMHIFLLYQAHQKPVRTIAAR